MIVLDTRVLSEAMKPEPHPAVYAWLSDQAAGQTALRYRHTTNWQTQKTLGTGHGRPMGLVTDRVLPFDVEAARNLLHTFCGLWSAGLGRSAALVFLPIAVLLAAKRRLAAHPDPTATVSPDLCRGSLSAVPIRR